MKINKNNLIVSDFEIIKYNLLNLNNELVNPFRTTICMDSLLSSLITVFVWRYMPN